MPDRGEDPMHHGDGGPHGVLRGGNRPGDPDAALCCGARTRAGAACRGPAMRNGRCRMHGGASTGPRTAAGMARLRAARTRHGRCAAEAVALRRALAGLLRRARAMLRDGLA